MSVNLTSH